MTNTNDNSKITALLEAGYDLHEIARTLDTTIAQIRRQLPDLPLCMDTLAEMTAELAQSKNARPEQLCRKYCVSLAHFNRLLYTTTIAPNPDKISNMLRAGATQQQVKANLGCKTGDIKAERDRYIKELLRSKKYSHEEIARQIGCSRVTVSLLNPTPSTPRIGRRLTPQEWQQLHRDLARRGNVTLVAKKYGITRTAIYNNIKRAHHND